MSAAAAAAPAKVPLGPCPHSHANWTDVVVRHYAIAVTVDFTRKLTFGSVDITLEALNDAKEVRFDAKHLAIERVTDAKTGEVLAFTIPKNDLTFGSCLSVPLTAAKGSKPVIRVVYSTTAHSGGLQWLEPEQTGGKKHPFVYSQFEAILARTFVPCQDTPAVKAPYTIAISAPPPLTAVASGNFVSSRFEENGLLTWTYNQPQPIPAYLIAFVCGHLVSAKVGPRSSVWCEKNLLERSVHEFSADTENYIVAGEKVTGVTYDWGPYDMVVLPSAFPYGGMENPQLTFLSSSLLAGDRSLTNVVCHEIMHSWAGNYVTNAAWSDFWLNEGFDVYLERQVLGEVNPAGEAYRHFEILSGYNDLVKTVHAFESGGQPELTRLTPPLVGMDPDEAFSKIPYEKGSLFLFFLERHIHGAASGKYKGNGKQGMRDWLKTYYTDFRAKSLTVAQMKAHFLAFFSADNRVDKATIDAIDWNHWLNEQGLPKYSPADDKSVDRSLVVGCEALAQKWLVGGGKDAKADDLKSFSSKQTMFFLDTLINSKVSPNPFAPPADAKAAEGGNPLLAKIDSLYSLTASNNVEIGVRFLNLCLTHQHHAAKPATAKFLSQHGRGLYVKPLYSKLAALDKEFAKKTYAANKSFYHSIIRHYCAKGLGLGSD